MNPLVIAQLLSLVQTGMTVFTQIQQVSGVVQKMQAEGRTEPTADEWNQILTAKNAALAQFAADIQAHLAAPKPGA